MKLQMTAAQQRRGEQGMTLIELIIAMAVLAVGVLALLALITVAMRNNNRSKLDTGGTMVAQVVIEALSAQSSPSQNVTVTDCSNTPQTLSGAPGSGAALNANGGIDFVNQAYAAVPLNYKMLYRECGQNGVQMTYDVRWNIQQVNAYSRLVTVSARPSAADNSGSSARMFQAPVNLRTIVAQVN
jgi:prepilin-type N-terminal cleavage/methylation domain-containing protein